MEEAALQANWPGQPKAKGYQDHPGKCPKEPSRQKPAQKANRIKSNAKGNENENAGSIAHWPEHGASFEIVQTLSKRMLHASYQLRLQIEAGRATFDVALSE